MDLNAPKLSKEPINPAYPLYPPPPYTISAVELGQYPHPVASQIPASVVVNQPLAYSQVQAQAQSPTPIPTPTSIHSVSNNGWMHIPTGVPNCPPGFECLSVIDELILYKPRRKSMYPNTEFSIKNKAGHNVYWAAEDSGCCSRHCFGTRRSFEMKLFDAYRNQVISFNRRYAPKSCCFTCYPHVLEVMLPNGQIIGRAKEEYTCYYTNFALKNHNDDTVLRIEQLTDSCMSIGNFKIVGMDGDLVGTISRPGDHFVIKFPMSLDVQMKAIIVGACVLIDSMHWY